MRVYPNSPISLMGFDRNPRGGRRMLGESRPYKRRPVINVTSVMADDSFRSVLLRAIRNSIHPGYTFECVFHQCIGMCSSTSIKIQPFRGVVKSDTHTQTLHIPISQSHSIALPHIKLMYTSHAVGNGILSEAYTSIQILVYYLL